MPRFSAQVSARDAYEAAAEVYDDFTADHDYDGWTSLIERLARAHGLQGARLLDVGCGTGKSFLPFLEREYRVVGCDVSPAMLARASAKCSGRARLLEADVRALPCLGAFDLVLAIDDVVNYLTADELVPAFAGLAANLATDGILVFDLNSELTFNTFFATLVERPIDRGLVTWRGHVVPPLRAGASAAATLSAVLRQPGSDERRVVSRHVQHHHRPVDVHAALRTAGLRCLAMHGMGLHGAITPVLDEQVHTKAMLVASRA